MWGGASEAIELGLERVTQIGPESGCKGELERGSEEAPGAQRRLARQPEG